MSNSKDKLVDYIVELNADAKMLAKHNADSEGAARAYGLSDDDIELVKSQNHDEIKARFANVQGAKVDSVLTFHTAQ